MLREIFAEYWEHEMKSSPTWATRLGDRRYENHLEDRTEAGRKADEAKRREFLDRARSTTAATPDESLDLAVFEHMIEDHLDGLPFNEHVLPMDQLWGVHMTPLELPSFHPTDDREGLEHLVQRYEDFSRLMDESIECMREGIELGVVHPRIISEKLLAQVRPQADTGANVEQGPMWRPFASIPAQVDGAERIAQGARAAIKGAVVPAFGRLVRFLEDEYVPVSREGVGLCALADGEARYAHAVRQQTTTTLTADEIHQVGLDEVSRIRDEMRQVMGSAGFHGSMEAFNEFLRTDRRFYFEREEQLLDGFRSILDAVEGRLPEVFGRLPKQPFEIVPIESYRAADAPEAYYCQPAQDGSRPGQFYANTHEPQTRPRWGMESLAYHEAVPGHHLQIALAQELEHLPMFRRHGPFTAYIEGWALYSEALPKELGFYTDRYSDFGRLTNELWRGVRLVVDTGLHHLGWSRQAAMDYFRENTAITDSNIEAEVDRYIVMPGQALSYKIGELRILGIRKRAEAAVENFDIRSFHDRLLGGGALPLDVLDRWMDTWIEAEQA